MTHDRTEANPERVGLLTVGLGNQTVEVTNVTESDFIKLGKTICRHHFWWRTSLFSVASSGGVIAVPVDKILYARWKQND